MNRIFSNGPSGDFVINPFTKLMTGSSRLYLAAPYFTEAEPLRKAAQAGKSVQLIVGLNEATSPQALTSIHNVPNLAVRFLTRRFHAKMYIFDDAALIGSSNLTDGGLRANREAVLCLDRADDLDAVEELRALFLELWESAQVLTSNTLDAFAKAHAAARPKGPSPERIIEDAVGKAEPANIRVESRKVSRERIFLQQLKRLVCEQYRPAFSEVTEVLGGHDLRRADLAGIGEANETNRFLNWVRLSYVIGDETWQSAPLRSQGERRNEILRLGQEWNSANNDKVPADYIDWLHNVERVFGSEEAIEEASREELTEGLMSLHAFTEQSRFVKDGIKNLPAAFWSANGNDLAHVKESLTYLLYGPGDFIERLHDILYDPAVKLRRFGQFCALELYGTIKPGECPPMNGRMAKALRYLGYDVRTV